MAPAAPSPAPARSAKTKIAIAAGAGAFGLALVAILVLALGGGKGVGKATPDDLVRAAIDRATAGDGDGLVALGGIDHQFDVALRCNEASARAARDGAARSLREHVLRHLDKWQALTITVDAVEPMGDPDVLPPGAGTESGCATKVPMATQQLRATVTVADAGGDESHTELVFGAVRVDGGWYLDEMPGPPAVGGLAKLRRIKDEMCTCKDTGCAQRVFSDFEAFDKDLTTSDTVAFSDEQATIVHALMDCEMKAIH